MTSFKGDKDRLKAETAQAIDFDKAKANRRGLIDANLKVLGAEQVEDEQMLNIVVQAAIRKHGLPTDSGVFGRPIEAFALDCEKLSQRLVLAKRKREWSQVRDVMLGLNFREPNELHPAQAKRVGVELPTIELPTLVPG